MKPYNTVKQYAREEIIIKKSRFIASVGRVESEDGAWDFIKRRKEEFYDAAHNVFGFRIGKDGQIEKQHDDGEPGGTAGKPVLEVIKKGKLTDTVVVVTRYFGGIYLGAGGLVRAYSSASRASIKKAGIISYELYKKLKVTIDYSSWGKIQNELKNINGKLLDTTYKDFITLVILIPPHRYDYLQDFLNNLTGGKGIIKDLGELYIIPG